MTKGQNIRLWISADDDPGTAIPVACATNMTLHVAATVENSTTKDDDEDWVANEVTGLSFDITSEALVIDDESTSVETNIYELVNDEGADRYFLIAAASGDNNRSQGAVICSGAVVMTSATITAENRQNSTLSMSFTGTGGLTVGS